MSVDDVWFIKNSRSSDWGIAMPMYLDKYPDFKQLHESISIQAKKLNFHMAKRIDIFWKAYDETYYINSQQDLEAAFKWRQDNTWGNDFLFFDYY